MVSVLHYSALKGVRFFTHGMADYAVTHFICQVQAAAFLLEDIDYAEALLVVLEAAGKRRVEGTLSGVAERRVTEVMAESNGLRQVLVHTEGAGYCPRNLRDLERMCKSCPVMVTGRCQKDLSLVFESSEGT